MNDLDWKQPALIGGLIAGILSTIPFLNLVNCCLCAWPLLGGAVAAKMLIDRSPRPVKSGEGAQVGLMAGLIAAGIYIILSVPLILIGVEENFTRGILEGMAQRSADPKFQEMMQQILEASANQTRGQRLVSSLPVLIILSIIYGGFTILGGLLGVSLFEKRKDQYPPQPPNYPPPGDSGANYPPQGGGYGGGQYGGGQSDQGGQGGWPQS